MVFVFQILVAITESCIVHTFMISFTICLCTTHSNAFIALWNLPKAFWTRRLRRLLWLAFTAQIQWWQNKKHNKASKSMHDWNFLLQYRSFYKMSWINYIIVKSNFLSDKQELLQLLGKNDVNFNWQQGSLPKKCIFEFPWISISINGKHMLQKI